MKRILWVLIVLGMITNQATWVAAETSGKPMASVIEQESGKIESLIEPDTKQGTLGGFTLITSGGKKMSFDLLARTRIFNSSSAPLAFGQLVKGDKVRVLYVVTLKGGNTAISVTQTK